MVKSKTVTFVGAFIGLVLVLIGIFGPWFSFEAPWRIYNETTRIYGETTADMSPFTIRYSAEVIATSPIEPHERTQRIIPTTISVADDIKHLYDPLAFLIGIACITGAIIGLYGHYGDKENFAILGGVLNIFSPLSFFFCLPRNIDLYDFLIMRNWYLTFLGGILITSCAMFHLIGSFVESIVNLFYQRMSVASR